MRFGQRVETLFDLPRTASELGHDGVSFLLRHVTVHRRDLQEFAISENRTVPNGPRQTYGEVCVSHLFGQPVNLSLGVAEDDGLGNGQRVVPVTEVVREAHDVGKLLGPTDRSGFRI